MQDDETADFLDDIGSSSDDGDLPAWPQPEPQPAAAAASIISDHHKVESDPEAHPHRDTAVALAGVDEDKLASPFSGGASCWPGWEVVRRFYRVGASAKAVLALYQRHPDWATLDGAQPRPASRPRNPSNCARGAQDKRAFTTWSCATLSHCASHLPKFTPSAW